MRHDSSIPIALHAGTSDAVKSALGAFWSSVFADQELMDGLLEARVLSACQKYIDAMEALSLRDHGGMPVFHREHWHPVLVRLSERNTDSPLVVGMHDAPVLGPQPEPLPAVVLPPGYEAVEWIESYDSKLQYINTGYVPNSRTVLRAKVRTRTARTNWASMFGVLGRGEDATYGVLFRQFALEQAVNGVFGSNLYKCKFALGPDVDISVELRAGGCTVEHDGGVLSAEFDTDADKVDSIGGALYLFCEHFIPVPGSGGQDQPRRFQNVRLYSMEVLEDDGGVLSLQRRFTPCRDPDGRFGLWDSVRHEFHPNLGTGDDFRAGPVVAPPSAHVYQRGEVFEVGGNALYSKVNTYPLRSFDGCRLVSVRTGLFDSIARPRHILSQGRDFDISGNVLVIRKEHDPFDVDGYRVVEDGDDSVAVLWACDAEYDTDNVRDFLAYPLGFDVDTTPAAARMLSALWDTVVYGLTPRCLNSALGALFSVPVIPRDTTVESVTGDMYAGTATVVTSDDVYVLPYGSLLPEVKAGAQLHAGDFLVKGITVRHGLSKDEIAALVTDGSLSSLTLLPGSVRGVDVPVVLESMWTGVEDGGWFKLNSGDFAESPFWSAVRSHASAEDLTRLCEAAKEKSGEHAGEINPVLALGYLVLANTILVESDLPLSPDPCAGSAFAYLQRLVPAYASLLAMCRVSVDESAIAAGTDDNGVRVGTLRPVVVPTGAEDPDPDTAGPVSDSVACTMVPIVNTEV